MIKAVEGLAEIHRHCNNGGVLTAFTMKLIVEEINQSSKVVSSATPRLSTKLVEGDE